MTHALIPIKWLLETKDESFRSIETQQVHQGVLITAKTYKGETLQITIKVTEVKP